MAYQFANEAELRADIVRIGRLLHTRDLVDGSAGDRKGPA